jgi:CheY-like chemotaxis protein
VNNTMIDGTSDALNVLVVDDSKVSRIMSTGLLRKLQPGVVIHEAANADEALALLDKAPVHWMLLDHNMPGTTGLDLAQGLRQSHPFLRIALLTANIQDATQQRAAEVGIHFFRKPIGEAVIRDIIRVLSQPADALAS